MCLINWGWIGFFIKPLNTVFLFSVLFGGQGKSAKLCQNVEIYLKNNGEY
ncbi:hypothetical protein PcPA57_00060 [Pasteurella canis]|uniref:Uncharacterized protein n=1 Tax=Pasteurella canis TaxID=753 RepID=A0ABQ4VFA9_9PAST|nr:hypothetical protein PA42_08610 [Pasteurella canis]GJJ79286.1 hypothetical protein PcPA57_00060 [Pasteurella canis]